VLDEALEECADDPASSAPQQEPVAVRVPERITLIDVVSWASRALTGQGRRRAGITSATGRLQTSCASLPTASSPAAQTVEALHRLAGTAGRGLCESRLYDIENWPQAGRRPSISTMHLLARIYGTHPARLLTAGRLATYPRRDQHTLHTDG
jgi:hypothetical protein